MLKAIELLRNGTLFPRYDGIVAMKRRGPLALLNYTLRCEEGGAWDEVTSACRGLIVDTRDWTAAARPFDKFFNVGMHRDSVKPADLPEHEPFTAFEKVDGTLGILYRDADGTERLSTRGSFDSPQAVRGTQMLHRLPPHVIPDEFTAMFEIVYPRQHSTGPGFNFSVIRYGVEELVLLGLRNRFTGEEMPWADVVALAARLGVRVPRVRTFASVQEAYAEAKRLPEDEEGFVLRFDGGLRVKMKGHAYLRLQARVWDITPKGILETLVGGGDTGYHMLTDGLPEEVRAAADAIADDWRAKASELRCEAEAALAKAPRGDRSELAAWIRQPKNVRPKLCGTIFRLIDGKPVNWYALIAKLA